MKQEFSESSEMNKYEAIKDIQDNLAKLLYESEAKLLTNERRLALAKEKARNISSNLLDIAMDIDEKINELLSYPEVLKNYDYNGKIFNPKVGSGFSRVLDGKHSLTTLRDNLRAYFNSYKTNEEAIDAMVRSSKKLLEEAGAVLENWKENYKISVVMPDIMEDVLRQHKALRAEKERDNVVENKELPPLANYEKRFDKEVTEAYENIKKSE